MADAQRAAVAVIQTGRGGMRPRATLLIGLALAGVGLIQYSREKIDPETFALDPASILAPEVWRGVAFTAPEIIAIRAMIEEYQRHPPIGSDSCQPRYLLWLGNSQLHFINQFRKGEHIAPYWLRQALDCPETTIPLGVSLSGANLQEHYVLANYIEQRLPISAVVIGLSFNDLREDGLRADFSGLLQERDFAVLESSEAGAAILGRAQTVWRGRDLADEKSGLKGFVQLHLEDALDEALTEHWSLWQNRKYLRSRLYIDFYGARNALLGMKETTVRRIIPQRYERNMAAFEALLREASSKQIPMIAYFEPLRPGIVSPYEPGEYAAWKRQVESMTAASGAVLLDLESLVPAVDWELPSGQIDITHFDGRAHVLLAAALLPRVRALLP
jgi:hypothetical protein